MARNSSRATPDAINPSADERALWAAIRAAPGDDLPRLVYADWLDEHGRGERAEFIRVQCALENLPADRRRERKRRLSLQTREADLLAAHADGWLAPLRAVLTGPADLADLPGPEHGFDLFAANNLRFARGLANPEVLSLAVVRRLADAGDAVEPVNEFAVRNDGAGAAPDDLDRVAAWPGAGCVWELFLLNGRDRHLFAVAGSTTLASLRALYALHGVTDAGVAAVAGWPLGAALVSVGFAGAPITDAAAAALAESPHLTRVERVDVRFTGVTAAGADRLRRRFRSVSGPGN